MSKILYPYQTKDGLVICSKFDNLTKDAAKKRLTLGYALINRSTEVEPVFPVASMSQIEQEINEKLYMLLVKHETIIADYIMLTQSKKNINDCLKHA
jgi:AAA15 family ATPase/GTPase